MKTVRARITTARSAVVTTLRAARPAEMVLWVALFSMSWDRVAIQVGSFSVKLPMIAFALAALLALIDRMRTRTAPLALGAPLIAVATVASVCVVATIAAVDRIAAGLQLVVILLGALTPFVATWLTVRDRAGLLKGLTAVVWGGAFAAAVGLIQWVVRVLGFPDIFGYEALGNGLPRISSFNYEAAYFGYFLVLVLGAIFARDVLRGRPSPRWFVLAIAVVLILANSRATLFTLPLLVLFLLLERNTRTLLKRLVIPVAGLAVAGLAAVLLIPGLLSSLIYRVVSVADPNELSSNAPRLDTYGPMLRIVMDHPWLGIGPGNLAGFAREYGVPAPPDGLPSNRFIANNIWIQAALDGGVFLLAAEFALVLIAILVLFRRSTPVARALIAGWICVIAVNGLLTSIYFDAKPWAILALAALAGAIERSTADEPTKDPSSTLPPKRSTRRRYSSTRRS